MAEAVEVVLQKPRPVFTSWLPPNHEIVFRVPCPVSCVTRRACEPVGAKFASSLWVCYGSVSCCCCSPLPRSCPVRFSSSKELFIYSLFIFIFFTFHFCCSLFVVCRRLRRRRRRWGRCRRWCCRRWSLVVGRVGLLVRWLVCSNDLFLVFFCFTLFLLFLSPTPYRNQRVVRLMFRRQHARTPQGETWQEQQLPCNRPQ